MATENHTSKTVALFVSAAIVLWIVLGLAGVHDETREELRQEGYVPCSNWDGYVGVEPDAECISHDGDLVEFQDTEYGQFLQELDDYAS